MAELRKRTIEAQVDTIRIKGVSQPGLRVAFKATRTLKPEPNSCDLTVYNLTADHRAALTKVKRPVVQISAGYEGELTQVFFGQAVHVKHERRGADILTTISTSDGGQKMQMARVHQSFGAGAKTATVLRAIVKAIGIKDGNLNSKISSLATGKSASIYVEGVSLSGQASTEMTALCRSCGLEWSIQDGALQLLDAGKTAANFATVLTENLLLGTPSVSSKNIVEGRTFLQKDFLPGRQIQIKSELVTGAFRLEKCEYIGDTYTDDWAVEFEAKGPPSQ
jgi:hypothetical protein